MLSGGPGWIMEIPAEIKTNFYESECGDRRIAKPDFSPPSGLFRRAVGRAGDGVVEINTLDYAGKHRFLIPGYSLVPMQGTKNLPLGHTPATPVSVITDSRYRPWML